MRELYFAIAVFFVVLFLSSVPHARDLDGRYAQSPLHSWFDSLASSSGGRCCSLSDGNAVEDPDWEVVSDQAQPQVHYRVRLGGVWMNVYDGFVVRDPNKDGRAFVWILHQDGIVKIRCFMPGSMT